MKKPQPTTTVTLRLPPDIVAAMKVAAESDERSLSFIALKWLRLGQNAATAISAPAPAAPDVPAPPPKATPRVKPKPAQRQEKAPDGWWQELRMVNGKPPESRAIGIFKAAPVTSLQDALALNGNEWRELGAGKAIIAALNRLR